MMGAKHWIWAALAVPLAPAVADAQQADGFEDALREVFRDTAQRTKLGTGFQALSVFTATPGLAAAHYTLDGDDYEFDVRSIGFHPHTTFDAPGRLKPYLEANIGYAGASQQGDIPVLSDDPTRFDIAFHTVTAVVGGGFEYAVTDKLAIRAVALGGFSHVDDTADITGPFSDVIAAAGDGIFFDASTTGYLVGGAVGAAYHTSLPGDLALTAAARYNYMRDTVIQASDDVLRTASNIDIGSISAELDGPLPVRAFGRPLRWELFTGAAALGDEVGTALGFDSMAQAGAGLRVKAPGSRCLGISARNWCMDHLSVRASVLTGNNLSGYTAGVRLGF